MSLRNSQKATRKANRTARDAMRHAAQAAARTLENSTWENLENRLMMTIAQTDPTNVIFEAERTDADIVITPGSNDTNWVRASGAAVAGNTNDPSGGALVAFHQQATNVATRDTATVTFPINFTSAGVYRMYVRGKYTGGGDNSMWIAPHKADGSTPIDGDPADPTDNANPFDNHNNDTARAGNYNWIGIDSADVPVQYTVDAAGVKNLTYMIREQGYMIDKVVLSKNLALTAAELDTLSPSPAPVPAGSVTAHYYNDNFWGYNSASGGQYGRPASPSGTDPFPSQRVTVYRAGDVVKTVPVVNFDWGTGSPDPAIRGDDFSTVHVGKLTAPDTGVYTFLGFGDDDTHVFVNGEYVSADPGGHGIEDPRVQGSLDRGGGVAPITLTAGQSYDIVVLQAEGGGGAGVRLQWIPPSATAALGDQAPASVVPSRYLSPTVTAPAAPTGVTRSTTLADGTDVPAGLVAFKFTDNATNELHYELQRSTDGGASWVRQGLSQHIVSNDEGAPAAGVVVGSAPVPGTTALYRVVAWNYAGATPATTAPISVTAGAQADVAGVSGYYYNDQFWKGYPNANLNAPSRSNAGNDVIVGRNPDASAVQPNIAVDWGEGSPVAGVIQNDNHSTVHQGKLHFDAPGVYTILPFSDDDSYVWIGNQLVGAHPGGHGVPRDAGGAYDPNQIPVKNAITITDTSKDYDFTVVQSEGGWGSAVFLTWVTPDMAPTDTPVNVPDANYVSALPSVPTAPTGLTGNTTFLNQIPLTFTDTSKSEVRYVLQRSTTAFSADPNAAAPAGTVEKLLPIVANNTNPAGSPDATVTASLTDTGLDRNTTYFYRLRAENFVGNSPWTTATLKTSEIEPIPGTPTNLSAHNLGTFNRIIFTDTAVNETGFVVERRLATATDAAFAPISTSPIPGNAGGVTGTISYDDQGVDPNTTYVYRVRAINSEGGASANTPNATTTQAGAVATIFATRYLVDHPTYPTDPLVRVDSAIDFNFDALPGGGPAASIPGDNFSIRWESTFTPATTGTYIIHGISDDGIRVYLDGVAIVDQWVDRGRTDTPSEPIELTAGTDHRLVVEYYENGGGANVTVDAEVNGGNRHVLGLGELSRKNMAPVAPTDVTATATVGDSIAVSWADVQNVSETGYEVQRSTNATTGFATVGTAPANATKFFDVGNGKVAGTDYYYRVRALGSPAASAFAEASAAATSGAAPSKADINFANFADPATQALFTLNGTAAFRDADLDANGTTERLMLTEAQNDQIGSAYLTDPRYIGSFNTSFDFQLSNSNGADGFAFVIQAADTGTAAIGGGGGALGYAGIPNSFAVKYDFYPNPATNQTGVYANGEGFSDAGADRRNRDIPTALDLDNGTLYHTTLSYDGATKTLTQTIDDDNAATPAFTATYQNVDIPAAVNGGNALVGFTGGTGGLNARQEITNFKFSNAVTPPGAKVSQVFVNGQGITGQSSGNGIGFRTIAGVDSTYGYPIPAGANQLKYIPWANGINKISLRFTGDVGATLGQDDLVVHGINTPNYTISSYAYDAATKTGTWTLTNAIGNDKIRLIVDDAGVSGLDGEFTTGQNFPSGNDAAGGDFAFRFNVLRGDANQDGFVNALDLGQLKARLNRNATTNQGSGATGYSPFVDLNADGQINALDLGVAKLRLNNRAPTGEPTALLFSSTAISR